MDQDKRSAVCQVTMSGDKASQVKCLMCSEVLSNCYEYICLKTSYSLCVGRGGTILGGALP